MSGRADPGSAVARTPEQFFAANEAGLAAYRIVHDAIADWGGCEERVGRSQVAFRCRRAFAWLWNPRQYLRNPGAEVVLSFALDRQVGSTRVKQAVRTSSVNVVHHVELRDPAADLDEELLGWLREAYERAC